MFCSRVYRTKACRKRIVPQGLRKWSFTGKLCIFLKMILINSLIRTPKHPKPEISYNPYISLGSQGSSCFEKREKLKRLAAQKILQARRVCKDPKQSSIGFRV